MIDPQGTASYILVTLIVLSAVVFVKWPGVYGCLATVILFVGDSVIAVFRFLFRLAGWIILFGTLALAAWLLVRGL